MAIEDRDWYRANPPRGGYVSPARVDRPAPARVPMRTVLCLLFALLFWGSILGAWAGLWPNPIEAFLDWGDVNLWGRF